MEKEVPRISMKDYKSARLFITGIFGFLLLIGFVSAYFIIMKPVMYIIDAKNWKETPCIIISSEVKETTVRGKSSTSTYYYPQIVYSYKINGHTYRSGRVTFIDGARDFSLAYDVVKAYGAGKKTVCYVNPASQDEAVLDRKVTGNNFFFAIIPLGFFAFGLIGLIGGLNVLKKVPIKEEIKNE
ncbi:MAG: DUF3592 domain-containing protein [Candidatus Eremiobacterota bacterium]